MERFVVCHPNVEGVFAQNLVPEVYLNRNLLRHDEITLIFSFLARTQTL